jgi:uncharacterized protein (DUF1778 family)
MASKKRRVELTARCDKETARKIAKAAESEKPPVSLSNFLIKGALELVARKQIEKVEGVQTV